MSAWRAERSRGGEWVAARTEREDAGASVHKVRKRRRLGIPSHLSRNEAQAVVNRMASRGELD